MDNVINYVIIIFSFILGIQILRQKWLFLIAGFNLSSTQDKKSMNVPVMSKIIGVFCLCVGFLLLADQLFHINGMIVPGAIIALLILVMMLTAIFAKKK